MAGRLALSRRQRSALSRFVVGDEAVERRCSVRHKRKGWVCRFGKIPNGGTRLIRWETAGSHRVRADCAGAAQSGEATRRNTCVGVSTAYRLTRKLYVLERRRTRSRPAATRTSDVGSGMNTM